MQTEGEGGEVRQIALDNFTKSILAASGAFAIWMGATTYTSAVRLSVIETKLDGISDANTNRYVDFDRRIGRLERVHELEGR